MEPVTPNPDKHAFEQVLAAHPRRDLAALPGRRNDRPTGVMVPVVWAPRPSVIVTLRPRHLPRHGGEVCFPGGRPEAGDADLWATAVREAHEELGITGAELLGRLSSIPLYTSEYRLDPFVAAVPDHPLRPDAGEVAAVFRLGLDEVLARPRVEGIPYTFEGREHLAPYFELGPGAVLFGATALAFWELVVAVAPLFGASPPPLVPGRYRWSDLPPRA
ncbi:MAG: CoA pyrophosphatase [Deltaproteobacteria bacterium]|nr:MAG: CoA pyrophosphatase [Deltaproteobacteria bacterium]